MIIKDSEPLDMIARCLYSVAPHVDGLFLTITHTTSKKKAKELARNISVLCVTKGYPEPEISHFTWIKDFGAARNFNLSQIPQNYSWVIWLDTDDVLRGGKKLREVVQKADDNEPQVGAIFFNYLYRVELDKDLHIRQILIEHLRERLFRNNGTYKWVAPIHETLIEQKHTVKINTHDCDVVHMSTDERTGKAILRNVEILEKQLEEQGDRRDPRTIYYLGKCYFDFRTPEGYEKAESLIKDYLYGTDKNTPSGWDEERSQAWEYLSEIYREQHKINASIKCLANALIEYPQFPQFYIDMALAYCYKNDWKKAEHWVKLSQQIPYPTGTTVVLNPRDMQARVLEVLFNIAVNTDDIDGAWAAMRKLVDMFPEDQSVKDRYNATEQLKKDNEIAHAFMKVVGYLRETGQQSKLQSLAQGIPDSLKQEPMFLQFRQDVLPPKKWADNEIALVCGRGFEKWSPKNLDSGIGGSEEAVILISRELAKLGWKVTVYGDPEKEGDYDGVTYLSHYEFNANDEFNIIIGWRSVGFFDNKFKARKKFLWLHDVQNPLEYTKERVNEIDKIFVLSEAHKKTLLNEANKEYLTDDKFFLTSNGVTLPEFKTRKRNTTKMFYGSSYDRGLEHLLAIWKDVKKEVPTATLEVCYGWDLFDKVYTGNPERQAWKEKMNKLMEQDGITHHGRVGHPELEEIMTGCAIWAYPTHFYEISCITGMRAQMLGLVPVTTAYAALNETVQYGFKLDVSQDDIYEPTIKEQYKNALIFQLKKPNDTKEMTEWANNKFSWKNTAITWGEEFKR